jgi:hypothetical protein
MKKEGYHRKKREKKGKNRVLLVPQDVYLIAKIFHIFNCYPVFETL